MEELWEDIPNLSKYQISNLGRVKSKVISDKYINKTGGGYYFERI